MKNNYFFEDLINNKIFIYIILSLLLTLSFVICKPQPVYPVLIYKTSKNLIYAILLFFIFLRVRAKGFEVSYIEKLLFIYFFIGIIGAFIHGDTLKEKYQMADIAVSVFLSFIGISSFCTVVHYKNYLQYILIFSIIFPLMNLFHAYYTIIDKIVTQNLSYDQIFALIANSYEWLSIYANPNKMAFFLFIGFLSSMTLFFYYFIYKENLYLLILFFIIGYIIFITYFFTQSRNVIISSVIYIILSIILLFSNLKLALKNRGKKIFLLIVLFISLLLMIIIGIKFHIYDYVLDKTFNKGTSLRYEIWTDFLKDQFHNFDLKKFFLGQNFTKPDSQMLMHNFFFESWRQYGLPSALLFFYILFYMLWKNWNNSDLRYVYPISAALIFYSIFDHHLLSGYLWLGYFFFLFMLFAPQYKGSDPSISSNKS